MGAFDTRNSSLPVLTLVIAGMDSFNPCAFFVLLSLLGLLVHARSRNKMLLIGGIFVFFSGFIYFLFMAAWLNLWDEGGQAPVHIAGKSRKEKPASHEWRNRESRNIGLPAYGS